MNSMDCIEQVSIPVDSDTDVVVKGDKEEYYGKSKVSAVRENQLRVSLHAPCVVV